MIGKHLGKLERLSHRKRVECSYNIGEISELRLRNYRDKDNLLFSEQFHDTPALRYSKCVFWTV